MIKQRQEIGKIWESVIGTCQPHLYEATNTFYSAAFEYDGDWEALYADFVEDGGDGFYAMPQMPFMEPALKEPYPEGLMREAMPVANNLQKRLMLFKTHYLTIEYAEQQAKILARVL